MNVYSYVVNNSIIYKDSFGVDRNLYFFGHAWIKVGTYHKCGKNNGTVSLDFSPEHYFGGSTDFTVNDKSCYPEWFGIKLKSNQKEDEALVSTWRSSDSKWNPVNNCVVQSLANLREGMKNTLTGFVPTDGGGDWSGF